MPDVKCRYCGKIFFKSTGRFNEANKFKWNFYCSRNCQAIILKKRTLLICENQNCGNKFERLQSGISKHNFCSQTCAAIVNNQKRLKFIKLCSVCSKKFTGANLYYSRECAKSGRRGYTAEELLKEVKLFSSKHGRVPARREGPIIADRCRRIFGSWNKAIEAAGLQPNRSHDHRMYKRTITKAKDGHLCDSISEAIIDNWLYKNKIIHQRDVSYPASNHKADWSVGKNIFIEYFGLAKDSPRYDRDIQTKKNLCKKQGIKLIDIYPQDLYPVLNFGAKLRNLSNIL